MTQRQTMWLYLPELKRVEPISYWLKANQIECDMRRHTFKQTDPVFRAVLKGQCWGIISEQCPDSAKIGEYQLYSFADRSSPFYGYDSPYLT